MTLHLQSPECLYVIAARHPDHSASAFDEPKIAFWIEEEAKAFLALQQDIDPHGQGPRLTYIKVKIARFHIPADGAS